jgi:uncharacterized protein (TIGR03000 family)
MYSVVMMMALTAGADIPDCHRQRGSGCNGYGCSGYACSGYSGGGCFGGCFGGGHGRRHGRHGCSGNVCGGYGCAGYGCAGYGGAGCAGYGCGGGVGVIVVPDTGKKKDKLPPPSSGKGKKGEATEEEPITSGTIVVNLPADARLTVDGAATTSTTASRTLITPALQPGYEYYYTLRAEVVRDGQTAVQTQRVAVRSGEATQISFDFATSGVASNR